MLKEEGTCLLNMSATILKLFKTLPDFGFFQFYLFRRAWGLKSGPTPLVHKSRKIYPSSYLIKLGTKNLDHFCDGLTEPHYPTRPLHAPLEIQSLLSRSHLTLDT